MKKTILMPTMLTALMTLAGCFASSSVSSSASSTSSSTSISVSSSSVSSVSSVSSEVSSSVSSDSSVSSSESSSSSEVPTETLVETFNYGFDVDYDGEPAINAPEEGEGFLIGADGLASTINGSLERSAAPSWTFVYTGYDKNMPEFEIEAKIKYGVSTNDTGVFAIRICYDGCYDVQFSVKNTEAGWQGVQIYQAGGGLVAQHDNVEQGGLITDGSLSIVPDTDYVYVIRSEDDGSGTKLVSVFVNDVKVIEKAGLSGSTLNANAKHGMGAGAGTWVYVDYFKGFRIEDPQS